MSFAKSSARLHAPLQDPWVFRDGRKTISGSQARKILDGELEQLFRTPGSRGSQLSALITVGELESALADAGAPAAQLMAELTDAISGFLLGNNLESVSQLASRIASISFPASLQISPPEGFTYYALNPLEFADAADSLLRPATQIAVVGIRSIGTTLSALATAEFRQKGLKTERMTVRPTGHPYGREMRFREAEAQWVQAQNDSGAWFLIVDEGPGRSGSTFLAVAESLVGAGVPVSRITLLGSRMPDTEQFCSRDGKTRWERFNFVAAGSWGSDCFAGYTDLGGGRWRSRFLANEIDWPASWPQMERAKYLAPDGNHLYKFEGLGFRGRAALERARLLAQAGFGCQVEKACNGFVGYSIPRASPMFHEEASPEILDRMAAYCVFRAREFAVKNDGPSQLAEMVQFNLSDEFGAEEITALDALHSSQPVLADGKMQPHEWLRIHDGAYLKTDATWHGDDHFFPGPTSIAWDVAGAAAEWNLDPHRVEFLAAKVGNGIGEDLRPIMPVYQLAYAVFRTAWSRMALSTVLGTGDEPRVKQAYFRYRSLAEHALTQLIPREPLSLKLSALHHGLAVPENEFP